MQVAKDFSFSASHVLPHHPGKCSRLHGHNYQVTVYVAGLLNSAGFVTDFDDIKSIMKPLIDLLDHRHLNDFIWNPTAENIATWFAVVLHRLVDKHVIKSVAVTVCETDGCRAEWTMDDMGEITHGQGWREPDDIRPELKEMLAGARQEANKAANAIILANRPRVREIIGEHGGSIG